MSPNESEPQAGMAAPPRPLISSPDTLVRNSAGEVTITGTAPAGASVKVSADGDAANGVTVGAPQGQWSANLALAVGMHTILAELVGKIGGSDEAEIEVVDS